VPEGGNRVECTVYHQWIAIRGAILSYDDLSFFRGSAFCSLLTVKAEPREGPAGRKPQFNGIMTLWQDFSIIWRMTNEPPSRAPQQTFVIKKASTSSDDSLAGWRKH